MHWEEKVLLLVSMCSYDEGVGLSVCYFGALRAGGIFFGKLPKR